MNSLPFYIVDVFADAPYRGNQLAVFRNAQGLSTQQM
ncbi:PhzF family phenazine biosynthesis protein [Rufibacter ruber]|nr:PhzF family phenazine biosynthesis protein [Rufibacter ruber]